MFDVEPPVHRQQRGGFGGDRERQGPDVGVGVDDIEVALPGVDIGEQSQVGVRSDLDHLLSCHPLAQWTIDRGDELRGGMRSTSGEERHVVAGGDEAVAEGRDDPFGPAVAAGGHGLVQRCDLGDTHVSDR